MSIPVVTFGKPAGVLVSGLEGLRGRIAVVRHCTEMAELLAVCQSGLAGVAIISEQLEEVTASVLDQLLLHDVMTLVLSDDQEQLFRLGNLGVPTAATQSDPADLARQISQLVDAPDPRSGRGRARRMELGYADVSAESDISALPTGAPHRASAGSRRDRALQNSTPRKSVDHRVLALWGPIGSPGTTTIAVNAAAEAAAAGRSVLLIDADTYGPSVAAMLGLLDESAGLAQACRYAEQGALHEANLLKSSSHVAVGKGSFRVLTGLTRADRWPELRSSALRQVLELAKELFQLTVIDCSFALEADEEISFDTLAPRRNGVALIALSEADEVIAVGAADSIGVPRLLRGLDELATTVPAERITVVLNKVRAAAAGRRPEAALRQAWERFGPALSIKHFLPWEPSSTDRSLLAGQVLNEAIPDSILRQEIKKILGADAQQVPDSTVSSNRARRAVSG